jgi:hypothetical protein
MTDSKVNAERLLAILDKLFIVPTNTEERLKISGFTTRQAHAMKLFAEGKNVSDIAKEITNGSPFTQNAYDALGVGVSKVFEALVLIKELSENKELVSEVLKRGLNYKRRFKLEYK